MSTATIERKIELQMTKGIIYILTNPCLDGWIKIGMTERDGIEKRLQELNNPSNIPLTFHCYATYEVDDPSEVEKCIHGLIDTVDDSLHAREKLANGKIREREFFRISPEKAYKIFENIAILRNDRKYLKRSVPTEEQLQEEEIAEYKIKGPKSSFKSLGINPGEEISFLYDETIVAKVVDEKNVEYEGENRSVTALARKLLTEKGSGKYNNLNGWRYFVKDGVILSELRERLENSETDE